MSRKISALGLQLTAHLLTTHQGASHGSRTPFPRPGPRSQEEHPRDERRGREAPADKGEHSTHRRARRERMGGRPCSRRGAPGKGIIERDWRRSSPTRPPLVSLLRRRIPLALAADNLQKMGYTNVLPWTAGFKGWVAAGGEVVRGVSLSGREAWAAAQAEHASGFGFRRRLDPFAFVPPFFRLVGLAGRFVTTRRGAWRPRRVRGSLWRRGFFRCAASCPRNP